MQPVTITVGARTTLLQVLIKGPGYGLDLIERIKTQTRSRLILGQGSVYPALRALERDGLVVSYEDVPLPERSGRPRRYYKLTALGEREALSQRKIILALLKPARATS
jgi:PadR family transcriptional regulator PadR